MKVLFLNTSDTNGGAAKAAMRIMRGVQTLGIQVGMFVKVKSSADPSVIGLSDKLPHNVLFRSADWIANKVKNKWQHFLWRRYRSSLRQYYLSDMRSVSFHGAMNDCEYDVIHLHWINSRFLNLKLLRKINKPIVWTLHDTWAFCGVCHYFYECDKYKTHCGTCPVLQSEREKDLSYMVFEKKRRALAGLNMTIVTPSRWLGDCAQSSRLLGIYPVRVIPNCVDVDLFKPYPLSETVARWGNQIDYAPGKKYILFGAVNSTSDRRKGYSELLQALSLFSGENDDNVELLVLGSKDTVATSIAGMKIHSLGFVDSDTDLALLYSSSTIVVIPSLAENLSNVIMESLSCGTPVVAFNIGGNPDMIDHKKNGWLADDVNDLAAGIAWCLDDNHAEELALNARQKVLDCFTIDKVSRQYAALYESMIQCSQ